LEGRLLTTYKTTRCHNPEDHLYTFTAVRTSNLTFLNLLVSYGEGLTCLLLTRDLKDHLLSTVRDCLFNILLFETTPILPSLLVAASSDFSLKTRHTMVTKDNMDAVTLFIKENLTSAVI
jgi:hypothetical protein